MLNKFLVLSLSFSLFAENRLWTAEDIVIAHKQKNYVELVEHILDITPSNRNSDWALAFKDTIIYQIDSVNPKDKILVNLDTLDLLKQVLPKEQLDSTFLIKIGKFVRLNSNNHSEAVPWFLEALNNENKNSLCLDDDLKLSVIASLSLPESENKQILAAQSILNICWKELSNDVKSGFSDADGYYFRNTCKIFFDKEENGTELLKQNCIDNMNK